MRKTFVRLIGLLFTLSITGCASLSTISVEPPDVGATRSFESRYLDVVAAARKAIPLAGLKLDDEKPDGSMTTFLADRPQTRNSYGEVVRVTIFNWHGHGVARVISRPIDSASVGWTDFTEDIFTRIGQVLGEYP